MNEAEKTGDEHGFVLIEMLCALIIIGIASVAFLQISSASASHMTSAKANHQSYQFAQGLIDAERLKPVADFRKDQGQDISGKFNWTLAVEPLPEFKEVNAEQPVLARVQIEVEPANRSSKKAIKYETILGYGQVAP